MTYNLNENINRITPEFIAKRVPTREGDKALYQAYRTALEQGETRLPVFAKTEGIETGYPVLTHYGLATLSIDRAYMKDFYCPRIQEAAAQWQSMTQEELHLLRASLIEFALFV